MNPQLTPDDVRAIVREELGLDRPLSASVAADIAAAKAQAAKVAAEKLEVDGSIAGHRIARSNTSEAGPLTITYEWCACGAKGRMTVRGSLASAAGSQPHKRGDQVGELGEPLDHLGLQLGDLRDLDLHVDEILAANGQALDLLTQRIGLLNQLVQGSVAQQDSSSVVPDVAPSGVDATVEAPGDTARVNSSPRRVVGSRAPIIPPYTLYALTVAPSRMGSPSEPTVDLVESDTSGAPHSQYHRLRPSQARDLAAWLIEAADQAEAVTR